MARRQQNGPWTTSEEVEINLWFAGTGVRGEHPLREGAEAEASQEEKERSSVAAKAAPGEIRGKWV